MDRTVETLGRLRRFARMVEDLPAVDEVLGPLRAWLAASGARYRIVGGVAVVHHGYARTTEYVDVLVAADAWPSLVREAASYGFAATGARRFAHESGVRIDLLVEGEPLPRGDAVYPAPDELDVDGDVVGLAGLMRLKLVARRHQDLADVVALLKPLEEGAYLALDASVPPSLRARLWELRRDALDERAMEP
ncbi:MAG: hypothetical protein MUE69_05460 [Myxococcota bacterium]|nr:hypothetical protein [Myxococcota bacterium]